MDKFIKDLVSKTIKDTIEEEKKKKCKKKDADGDYDGDKDNDDDDEFEESIKLNKNIVNKLVEISENSLSLLEKIIKNEENKINSELSESIKELFEIYKEFLGEDENGELNELRKVVFRNGQKKVINKKRIKGIEKIHRKLAAKKAARKRKGKKRKATSIMKLKKSLKMRHKMGL